MERSVLGIRCARITLTAERKPAFTLFPMIHVADAEYFARVREDAAVHDLVLLEGIPARPARIASQGYRLLTGGAASLAYQGDYVRGGDFGRWDRADMDGPSFMERWRRLPLWLRLAFPLLLPVAWLALRFRGARRWLAGEFSSLDDSSRSEEILPGEGALGALRDLLLVERDAVLAARCDAAIAEGGAGTVAVIYGAGHMPALIRHLREMHGYRIAGSEWMTAIAA